MPASPPCAYVSMYDLHVKCLRVFCVITCFVTSLPKLTELPGLGWFSFLMEAFEMMASLGWACLSVRLLPGHSAPTPARSVARGH